MPSPPSRLTSSPLQTLSKNCHPPTKGSFYFSLYKFTVLLKCSSLNLSLASLGTQIYNSRSLAVGFTDGCWCTWILELWETGASNIKDMVNPIYGKRRGCSPGKRKQYSFPIECQSKYETPASISEFIAICMHVHPTYSSPWNQVLLTDTLNIIKTQKKEKIAEIQLSSGYRCFSRWWFNEFKL